MGKKGTEDRSHDPYTQEKDDQASAERSSGYGREYLPGWEPHRKRITITPTTWFSLPPSRLKAGPANTYRLFGSSTVYKWLGSVSPARAAFIRRLQTWNQRGIKGFSNCRTKSGIIDGGSQEDAIRPNDQHANRSSGRHREIVEHRCEKVGICDDRLRFIKYWLSSSKSTGD